MLWDVLHDISDVLLKYLLKFISTTLPVCKPARVVDAPNKIVASEFHTMFIGVLEMVDTVVKFELTLSWADLMPLAGRFSSADIIFTIEDYEVLGIWS